MRKFLWIVGLFFISQLAWANPSPMGVMQQVTDQTLDALKTHQATLKSDPKVVYGIIHRILLPHVDMQEMSKMVLGREVWMQATPNQRQRFVEQFKGLLVRTYSSALAAYKNETVKFMPVRGGNYGSRAQIDSMILQRGGPSISVSYRLVFKGGQWKLYDLIVDGVSLVESYRSQFADGVAQEGLDGVIEKLAQKNTGKVQVDG